jgi:hypothetical protein
MKNLSLAELFLLIGNSCGAGTLAFLWMNFLYAPWPSININPLWDILFLRTGGPLFYANHVSSCVAILGVTTYFAVKEPKHVLKWMFVIFTTASLHEFLLDLWGAFLPGGYFWISFVLVGGLLLANREQRMRMVYIALFFYIYMAMWVLSINVFHYSYLSIVQYAPGPALLSVPENIIEVVSWTVPLLLWFYPSKPWIDGK